MRRLVARTCIVQVRDFSVRAKDKPQIAKAAVCATSRTHAFPLPLLLTRLETLDNSNVLILKDPLGSFRYFFCAQPPPRMDPPFATIIIARSPEAFETDEINKTMFSGR